MPTRFYFPEAEVTPISPTLSAEWEHQATVIRRRLLATPDGSVLTTTALAPDAADHIADQDALHRQYVSDPLPAQTINGTVKAQFQALEANASNEQKLTLKVFVVDQAGVAKETLLAITRTATELAAALTNRRLPATAIQAATLEDNDRIVVEVGTGGLPIATTGVQGHNASLRFGCAGTDLPENETEAGATFRPWIEFSGNLSLVVLNGVSLRYDDVAANPDGTVTAAYTFGQEPLPESPAGTGFRGFVNDHLDEDDLVRFLIDATATYRRKRGFQVSQLIGRKINIDLSALENIMRVV